MSHLEAVATLIVDPANAAAQDAVRDLSEEAIAFLVGIVCEETPSLDASTEEV